MTPGEGGGGSRNTCVKVGGREIDADLVGAIVAGRLSAVD